MSVISMSFQNDLGGGGAHEGKTKSGASAAMGGRSMFDEDFVLNQQGGAGPVEDEQWKLVAKKLAFEEQMRACKGTGAVLQDQRQLLGTRTGTDFCLAPSDPKMAPLLAIQKYKPANNSSAAKQTNNKTGKTSTIKQSKQQQHAAGGGSVSHAQTGQMVNNMINKLLALDTGKLPSSSAQMKKLGGLNVPPTNLQNVVSNDRKFKSLPPAESLSRNETLGGYIFVCNNDTMQEDLKRQLFGLPQRYRDSVRAIQPGLPLFLYNYTTHQLHGVFEAASFGGSNIDPSAWEDKKNRGESRFPAQVRIRFRKICKPLDEDIFRPVLYHYDGPKFRLQLSIPETLALLDSFTAIGRPY